MRCWWYCSVVRFSCVRCRCVRDNQVFAKNMEKAVIETVEAGHMTKDLAICVHGWNVTEDQYLMTEAFIDEIKVIVF